MTLTRLLRAPALGAGPFTVYRHPGEWARGAFETKEEKIEAIGVVQPTGKDALEQLPEGDRLQEAIAVFTETELTPGGADQAADEIEWRGARYRVASVRRWDAFGYCQAVAVRAGAERSENG